MKKNWVLFIALGFMLLVACEKNKIESVMPDGPELRTGTDTSVHQPPARHIETLSTVDVKQRSAILFSLANSYNQSIKWEAVPKAEILAQSTWAYISFQKPGSHRVYAIDTLSSDTTFIDVTVANYYEQNFYDDDELFITPQIISDSANVVELLTVTKRKYECLNNSIVFSQRKQANIYQIAFDKVRSGNECTGGEKNAGNIAFIISDTENDQGKIEITFKNVQYKGSYRRKGKSYEFDWGYHSGVIFTIQKI